MTLKASRTVVIVAYLKESIFPMFELIPNPLDPDNPTNKVKDSLLYWKQNEVSNPILAKLACGFTVHLQAVYLPKGYLVQLQI